MDKTIYWHDYESFGADPRRDRASQFAGIRTDEALNIVGEPLIMYCKPAPDMLPHPEACLITGISPQKALAEGLCEAEFISRIHSEFSRPGTCVAGYNSIRFDDEMTRQILYRNFFDAYEREWKNGNSRWDIIDMVRLCHAVRPKGIQWPKRDDGATSFRLEELTAANGISHIGAHDALADVQATIELARLIRTRQPRLYEYVYQLRSKHQVLAQLNLHSKKPVLHVSSMYPAGQACMALVMPLARHPSDSNGIIVYDLSVDPASWLGLPAREIRERLYTRQEDLLPGQQRIPLKVVHVNRCPVLVTSSVLQQEPQSPFRIDLAACRRHWSALRNAPALDATLREVFTRETSFEQTDPDSMLYGGGFFSNTDKAVMEQVRACTASELAALRPSFEDQRLPEMLFRYRARNYPDSLDAHERQRWQEFCQHRINRDDDAIAAGLGLNSFCQLLRQLRTERHDASSLAMLDALESYAASLLPSAEKTQPDRRLDCRLEVK